MKMPGFTAERSLYAARAQYSMTATRFLSAEADVRPQMSACEYLEGRLPLLSNELAGAVARRDWDAHTMYMGIVQATLRSYRYARC
jgi:hypothetical protein